MFRLRVILFFFISCSAAFSQQKKIVFDHYGIQQGFRSRVCRTIVKTGDGMLWISTHNGLVRYDSKLFKYYQHIPSDSSSIANNFTDQLVADNNGNLWIVTEGELDFFDTQSERFLHTYLVKDGIRIKNFSPESLYFDSLNNRVWAGTWQGLYYCEVGETEFKKARTDKNSDDFSRRVFIDIKKADNGSLWLCNNDGLYKYNMNSGKFDFFQIADPAGGVKNITGAFCLFPENEETIWVGTWNNGLIRYDTKTRTGKHYYYSNHTSEQNGIIHINQTGLESEKNLLWISTPNKGLASFDKLTGAFQFYYSPIDNDKNGIKAITNRMLPTATEGMWIASENGMHRYDYSKQLFSEINLEPLNPDFKKTLPVEFLSFHKTVNNTDSICWFHAPYVGTYFYDIKRNKLNEAPAGLKKYLSEELFSSFVDASGIYWAGTKKFGLVAYQLNTGKLIFPERSSFYNDKEWVTGFLEDRKGRIWLATYRGLYFIDRSRKRITEANAINRELARRSLALKIQGMAEDPQGRIWLTTGSSSTQEGAIAVYDADVNRTTFFYEKQNTAQGFPAGVRLNNIACSADQTFVATNYGLLMFKSQESSPVFVLLNNRNGLIYNNVEQVVCDRQFNVWCSTEFGVSCYLPSKNFFINYTNTSSGIGPQNNPALYLSPNTGIIYISQQGMLNFVNPLDIKIGAAPQTVFTGMQLFNKPFNYKNQRLKDGDVIRLKHYQNMIAVEFSGMSFSRSDDNQFAYMLEGLEKEWNISKNNIASYTNLAPGKYRLLVKTSNSSGWWTPRPSVLTFIIHPPFWKTGWFISLIILSVLGALYLLYRNRIRQILRIQKIRNSISRNLHDEIGSTLTSISILSSVSQKAMEKDPEKVKEMLQQITEQSKTIQQNMSDIVWAVRSDNDKVENILVRMREYAAQTLEPLNIVTVINVDEMLLNKLLPLEARKEVLLIFKEAVNNIAKHSGCNKVIISLEKKDKKLLLEIVDNGKWKINGSSSGTGVGSIRQRAKTIGGKAEILPGNTGTKVLVEFPLT